MNSTSDQREGYILADAMAGLVVLSVGLAAFLGCLTQSHRLMRDAEALNGQRAAGAALIELRTPGTMMPRAAPAALVSAGSGLCRVSANLRAGRTVRKVSTVRFCALEEEAAR